MIHLKIMLVSVLYIIPRIMLAKTVAYNSQNYAQYKPVAKEATIFAERCENQVNDGKLIYKLAI